jgi:hypothetical protein
MYPSKHQHHKKRHRGMVYGGVVVPGMPYWSYYMSGVNGFGGGYMTGATPDADGDYDHSAPSEAAGSTGAGDAGAGAGAATAGP